jgi:aspartate/methionine/tyrosine aminotransferase
MSLSLQSVEPVYIPCLPSEGFKPSIEGTKRYLQSDLDAEEEEEGTRQIRMIVLVTPNNPTGAIYTHSELQEWYDLAKEYKVALVLDETYRDFVDGKPHELFAQEGWGRTLVSIGSMSSES